MATLFELTSLREYLEDNSFVGSLNASINYEVIHSGMGLPSARIPWPAWEILGVCLSPRVSERDTVTHHRWWNLSVQCSRLETRSDVVPQAHS